MIYIYIYVYVYVYIYIYIYIYICICMRDAAAGSYWQLLKRTLVTLVAGLREG